MEMKKQLSDRRDQSINQACLKFLGKKKAKCPLLTQLPEYKSKCSYSFYRVLQNTPTVHVHGAHDIEYLISGLL